ncbi:MAG TPA: DNA alkylation repair protein [Flavobacterium sp.]|jgi:3-methyladenine DNA glycosylase AlkD
MNLSSNSQKIIFQITHPETKLGDLRNIAKEIKKDHGLAEELWATGNLYPRLMAILILDKKELTSETADHFFEDIETHPMEERTQLADWLMANQLMKDKKTVAMMLSWENSPSAIKRRIFWYYQGRLRWTGQTPPDNTTELLSAIKSKMLNEEPEVQWAMNFTAGWIGIWDENFREQCIHIGKELGLYKDEVVMKNCSPNYLPEFIRTEVEKRKM